MKKIKINGKDFELHAKTVLDVLQEKRIKADQIVVELNGKVITKDQWSTQLQNNDVLELVAFVGGG